MSSWYGSHFSYRWLLFMNYLHDMVMALFSYTALLLHAYISCIYILTANQFLFFCWIGISLRVDVFSSRIILRFLNNNFNDNFSLTITSVTSSSMHRFYLNKPWLSFYLPMETLVDAIYSLGCSLSLRTLIFYIPSPLFLRRLRLTFYMKD